MARINKSEVLGMSYGTACNRLRKMILFKLVKDTGLNICHQCGKPIEHIDELSIEHKKAWLNADNPIETFFDLENIAFSHLSCNIRVHDNSSITKSMRNKAAGGEYSNCILAMNDAKKIRELSKTMKGVDIAKMYRVSKHTVYRILRGTSFNY